MARSFIVGGQAYALDPSWRAAQDALEKVRFRIQEQVGPGVKGSDLHGRCLELLDQAGFGKTMHHALGHGVGLRIHEPPYLGPASRDVLGAGMVVAIEPAITLANAGFRHEDVFLVTDNGCECLTAAR